MLRLRTRRSAGLFILTSSMLLALVVAAPVAAKNPAGNNGTVKIDALDWDNHPNNEPHVGCTFEVDFYGFDEGDLWADVIFEAHPPTGQGVLLTDSIFIGGDDNSGGGSEAGWDASRQYDLTSALSAYPVHPQQGYHVKLTIHADGSQGADTKHKVFWVGPCDPRPTIRRSTHRRTHRRTRRMGRGRRQYPAARGHGWWQPRSGHAAAGHRVGSGERVAGAPCRYVPPGRFGRARRWWRCAACAPAAAELEPRWAGAGPSHRVSTCSEGHDRGVDALSGNGGRGHRHLRPHHAQSALVERALAVSRQWEHFRASSMPAPPG